MLKKSQAIRDIVAKHGMGLTNLEIRNLCLSEHRLHVHANHVNSVVGSFHERIAISGYSSDLLNAARKYISLVGNLPLAKKILEVSAS